jgi:hypothetical protein
LPQDVTEASIEEGIVVLLPAVAGGIRKVPLYVILVRPETAGPAARAAIEIFQRHVTPLA